MGMPKTWLEDTSTVRTCVSDRIARHKSSIGTTSDAQLRQPTKFGRERFPSKDRTYLPCSGWLSIAQTKCCCLSSRPSNDAVLLEPIRLIRRFTWRYRTGKHLSFTRFEVRQRLMRSWFSRSSAMLMWIQPGRAVDLIVAMVLFLRGRRWICR